MKTEVGVRRALRASIVASAISAAALFGITATASAGTLDQQQTSFSGPIIGGVNSSQSLAQTFTAGITGRVDQVDLVLNQTTSPPPDPVTIEIRNVTGGAPGSTVLGSGSIPTSTIGSTQAFVSATLGTPAAVTAGTQYALVAYSTNTTGTVGWSFQPVTDPYPGGAAFNNGSSPPSGDWHMPPGDDFAFKTYVAPSPPSPPVVPHKKKCKKHKKKHKSGAQMSKKKCKKKKHRH
jgi:hypothetical protein